jgi:hypothetical protein
VFAYNWTKKKERAPGKKDSKEERILFEQCAAAATTDNSAPRITQPDKHRFKLVGITLSHPYPHWG